MIAADFFDQVIDRVNTNSVKWDMREQYLGGADVLPLWVADMDFRSPPAVTAALIERAQHPIYGYAARPERMFKAIQHWNQTRHHWEIPQEQLVINPGVVFALNVAVRAFTQAGDGIVVQPPVYAPFYGAITDNGRTIIENRLLEVDGRYQIDFADLDAKLAQAKMLVLCSPHNPVGRVWNADELNRIADLCLQHNVIIVSDEIHCDLTLFAEFTPLGRLRPDLADLLITLAAPSKTFNLPGLTTSYGVIANEEKRKRYEEEKGRSGYHVGTVFGDIGLTVAYEAGAEWLDALREYLRENYRLIEKTFAEHPQVRLTPLEGTYLAWLDFRATGWSEDELTKRFRTQAKVGPEKGGLYGEAGLGFWRVNFATPRSVLAEGLRRMQLALEEQRA